MEDGVKLSCPFPSPGKVHFGSFIDYVFYSLSFPCHLYKFSDHNCPHLTKAIKPGQFITVKALSSNYSHRVGNYNLVPPVEHVSGFGNNKPTPS